MSEEKAVMTTTMTTTTPTADIVLTLRTQFANMAQQFISALHEVFPECLGVDKYRRLFDERYVNTGEAEQKIVAEVMIRRYHQVVGPHYGLCSNRDARVFMVHNTVLAEIELARKFKEGLHPDTEKNIWSYVLKLNEFAQLHNLYSGVPTGMLDNLETLAEDLASQLQGPQDLKNLNFQELGEKVLSMVNNNDMQEFSRNLQSGGLGDMTQMFGMLQGMMGGLPVAQ